MDNEDNDFISLFMVFMGKNETVVVKLSYINLKCILFIKHTYYFDF